MINNRKQQILETVMLMLEDKQTLKITTASIAKKLNISEAALYRHFSSKKEIFTQLVDFIETRKFVMSVDAFLKEGTLDLALNLEQQLLDRRVEILEKSINSKKRRISEIKSRL